MNINKLTLRNTKDKFHFNNHQLINKIKFNNNNSNSI